MNRQQTKQQDILVFVLCYAAYATAYFCRANFAIALPSMISELNWSRTILGSIAGAFFWTYAIGQLVNGILGDILAPKILVGAGLSIASLCNILIYFFPNVRALTIFWIINGFALSALWGPIMRTVSLWYSEERQSRIALYLSTSMVMGYLFAWGGLGKILTYRSWRFAFLIPGITGLIVTFLWIILLPQELSVSKGKDEISFQRKRDRVQKGQGLNWGFKIFFLLIVCTLTQGIIKDGVSLWAPTLLVEYAGFSEEAATQKALLIPLASLFGMFLAGFSEKLTKEDDSLSFALLLLLSGFSWASLRFGTNLDGRAIAILISLAGAFAYGANTVLITFIPIRLASTGRVSTIAGFLDFLSYVGSAIAGPLTGYLVESIGWDSALSLWLILAVIGAVSSLGLRKRLLQFRNIDEKKRESV